MTRYLRLAAVAGALVLGTTISTGAQPPQGRGFGGPGRPGPGGPAGPLPILRELSLSDSQREQIRTIAQAQADQHGAPKLMSLQKQLQVAVFSDPPDQAKLDELRGAIAAAQAEELAARIDVESRIAQVLTPEQRAQARDLLSKPGPPDGPPPAGRRGRGRL
jgi:Spy/CpxP family protein refolding chaperone